MLFGDGVVVVVDGAGLPADLRAGCRHSVAWFANTVAHTFHELLTKRSHAMVDALAETITQVRASHAPTCDLEAGSPSATVAAWRISENRLEYLVLCDASVVLVDRDQRAVEITDRRLQRVLEATATVEGSRTDDVVRAGAAVRATRRRALETARNRLGGFWCVHTDPAAALHAVHGDVAIDDHVGVLVCSDGATRGYDLLQTHTIDQFTREALSGKRQDLAAIIRAGETQQAEQLRGRGLKVHDDLTLVAAPLDHTINTRQESTP